MAVGWGWKEVGRKTPEKALPSLPRGGHAGGGHVSCLAHEVGPRPNPLPFSEQPLWGGVFQCLAPIQDRPWPNPAVRPGLGDGDRGSGNCFHEMTPFLCN